MSYLFAPFKWLRWAFWNCAWYVTPRTTDIRVYLARMERCRWPWWKFRPGMYHNDAGHQWEVWFENEPGCTYGETIKVEACRAESDGRIVGLTIWDERLKGMPLEKLLERGWVQ